MNSQILNFVNCSSIAVMGGTFDPIHYGHLVAAEAVRHEFNVEKVLFIPAGQPAHKQNLEVTPSEHRYLMTVLATAANPYFYVSRMEIDRDGMTYTIDTIREIRKICRNNPRIYFITGADAVNEILTWKDPGDLLSLCHFVAVTRPGYHKDKLSKKIRNLQETFETNLHFLEIPALSISSSDIRLRVAGGKPIRYLLPVAVQDYIRKNGLYQSIAPDREDIENILKTTLSQKRFQHTLGVANGAARLAGVYQADREKAYLAGLLHDCAKEYSNEKSIKLAKKYHLPLDDAMLNQPYLIHSFLGAEIAKEVYHVYDEEILNAIRFHTTGRIRMSQMEKILYLADCIEASRGESPQLSKIRALAFQNLDLAVTEALRMKIAYTKSTGKEIHPLSIEALEEMEQLTNRKGENPLHE